MASTAGSGPRTVAVISTKESLGDGFFKLPVARAVRRAFPDRRVVWVVSDSTPYADVLARFVAGVIDELVPHARIERPSGDAVRHLRRLPRYDLAIDLRTAVRRVMLARLFLRCDQFVCGLPGYALSDRRPRPVWTRPRHWQDRMLALVAAASGRPVEAGGEVAPLPEAEARAAALLPAGPRLVGLVAGASGDWKVWPLDRFIALAKRIAVEGGVPVFLIGPAELAYAGRLRAEVPAALFPGADPAAGRHADPELMLALGRRLDAAVTNDTGLAHLLAAVGTPLVGLFGPTDPARWAPKAAALRLVRAQDHGGERMALIPVDAVAAALGSLLARPATGSRE